MMYIVLFYIDANRNNTDILAVEEAAVTQGVGSFSEQLWELLSCCPPKSHAGGPKSLLLSCSCLDAFCPPLSAPLLHPSTPGLSWGRSCEFRAGPHRGQQGPTACVCRLLGPASAGSWSPEREPAPEPRHSGGWRGRLYH